ncbi:MAG: hypothetical protein J6T22_10500 [Bacteroidales bacterium]|nr:hypothetical protein [Bacteroidales bacterium]
MDSLDVVPDTTSVIFSPNDDPLAKPQDLEAMFTVTPYAELEYKHQSAAVYGDYVFFVKDGREAIRMYDLVKKDKVYTFSFKREDSKIYHCNQSSFGIDRYDSSDLFPLLYISQRARSEKRCFTEVFRIIPQFNSDSLLVAFKAEKVQEIFFPPMSMENSMGNVNCVIDPQTGKMYTYSRNNDSNDDNFRQCRISQFTIPDIQQTEVILEDDDIESSFMIGVDAANMQGGCIIDGHLYIGQGYPSVKYIYLNVVDLLQGKLIRRYNLLDNGVDWEPEGCFFYDGGVMLSHTKSISRIEED